MQKDLISNVDMHLIAVDDVAPPTIKLGDVNP